MPAVVTEAITLGGLCLKEWVNEKYMAYKYAAKDLNCSPTHLKNICCGYSAPSLQLAIRIEVLSRGEVPCVIWANKNSEEQ